MSETTTPENLYTVAFYNLENLFDVYDDPNTLDDDFTPEGRKKWNAKRYQRKIKKLSAVISQIGTDESNTAPIVIGLAEVENLQVLTDLVNSKKLRGFHYGIVHYDSPDERGIDVAFLYQKKYFEYLDSKTVTLLLYDEEGQRDYTRDILWVKGKLKGELFYFIVNHWPSRRKGTAETEHKRIGAAKLNHEIIATINDTTENAKIIIMGDFNDGPRNTSIKQYLVTEQFYNPFESIIDKGNGSLKYDDEWLLFDQIILSKNFFDTSVKAPAFKQAAVFDDYFLKEWKGKRKGSPFRTYIGKWHQGGYSDHFPVYVTLQYSLEDS